MLWFRPGTIKVEAGRWPTESSGSVLSCAIGVHVLLGRLQIMTFLSRPAILAAVALSAVGLLGVGLVDRAAAQANQAATAKAQKAGEAFKNVTTSTLKELTV